MTFQLYRSPFTGEVDPNVIIYTDEDGMVWNVPEGHRFWFLYQDWLAEGNTPLPAA